MFLSPFLARRYLKPKRTFVSIITVISVLGVALGVWILVVVIAVFTGYGERIKESILGFEPHLIVRAGGYMENWEEPYNKVKEIEGVTSVTPFVMGQVMMHFAGNQSAPTIRGIVPPDEDSVEYKRLSDKIAKEQDSDFPDDKTRTIRLGKFDISDPYKAVVGDQLAEAQNIHIGDKLLLYSPSDFAAIVDKLELAEKSQDEGERKDSLESIREMTVPQEVEVTGIFDSGHWDFDANIIFVNLETAQVLYKFDLEEAHGIAVRTVDPFRANQFKEKIDEVLEQNYLTLTWAQIHKVIFDAVAAERQAMYLILCMIMVVGGFCIMNTMITVTYQKKAEIGLLKALGAREGQVAWVFLFQGILVGAFGVIVGLCMAEFTIWQRNNFAGFIGETFGVDLFSEEVYKVEGGLPAKQTLRDLCIISGFSFVACTLASLIPAAIAANLQPATALRSE